MKKFTMLALSIAYVILLFSVSAFAAKATSAIEAGIDPRDVVAESSKHPLTDVQLEQLNRNVSKPSGSSQAALGFLASPGINIGNTGYDIQHNSRMGRQIVQGPNGRVHMIWTHKLAGVAATEREIRYGSYVPNTGLFDLPGGLVISDGREGHMCSLDHFNSSALAAWRYGAAFAAYRTTTALDFASGAASFSIIDAPSAAVSCEGTFSGAVSEPYIWPMIVGDNDGGGTPIVHVVAMEGNTGSDYSAMVYFRGTGAFTNYGTCGKFIDSTTAISYTVAQDPNSNKVAIAYTKARTAATSRENNDVAYRMSNDLGVTWGPIVNVTNYASSAKERASQETSTLFDADGCYHILYVAAFYDSAASQLADQEAKLYHWDDCNNCRSLVLDANNVHANCTMKAFEHNVARVSITECTVGATKTIYAIYTRYVGDTNPSTPALTDCSNGQFPNGEIFASASSTGGETWGPPVNLTNSRTDNCASGTCDDDNFSSSAMYSTDSLRIQYINDKDAGSGVGNDGTAETYSPVMFLSHPCFAMDTYRSVTSTPAGILYPFHATTAQVANTSITLTNAGNTTANWTRTIAYNVGSNWLTVPASGAVTAGCTNSQVLAISAGPLATEGLYTATITFSYEGPSTFQVPVEFYVFDSFFLPQDQAIHTALVRMNVNQAGRNSHQEVGRMFYNFVDQQEPIYDGSLVLGNSATSLSWLIFEGGGNVPTVSNPFGPLYAKSNTAIDSTGNPLFSFASGKGANRDSTLGFDVTWYAPKHSDSSTFIIASYSLYKGTKNPAGSVTGLTVAYAADIDVPDDSSDNVGGFDTARETIYQRGRYAPDDLRFAGLRGVLKDGGNVTGGFAWENDVTVYPLGGYENDSLWNKLQATVGFATTDSLEDLNSVLTLARNATINGAANDTLHFAVMFVGTNGVQNLTNFQTQLDKARAWLCLHVYNGSDACANCLCGDANNSGGFSISDAVFIIAHIFGGGPAPAQPCLGDANGSGGISISDAVYLIAHIFGGGPAPFCP
ncbi:MAG: dockerin type I repeat-containing protein [bacterium]|nr:dockerin type I repeat-containing protein [bacterium]